ncbi:MAG: hypothetical protein D8M54_24545, partial [Chloroflexi bacterium]|nr:hypothetical protein [Chloroflexota bacterium]
MVWLVFHTVPRVFAGHQPVCRAFRHGFWRFPRYDGFMNSRDTADDNTHTFNVENELVSVSNNGNTTTFAYDAAGIRVKTVRPGGKTSYFPFPGYEEEVNGSTITRRITYSIAGQAVALRVQVVSGSNTLYYLHTDHLGSTSLVTTTGGAVVAGSDARYYPFGNWRTEPTAGLTDRGFTGHLHNNLGNAPDDIGLVYMQARWYLPGLGRFASADSIIPNPANPQSYNRYSYVLNRALNFTDPTGHIETPFTEGGSSGDDDLDRVEKWQRWNALTGELTAWPASIASQATVVKQVRVLAPISQGPLNEINILPQGSFVRVPAQVARVSAAGSYGLPIISGTINQYEIRERQQVGQITSAEANLETVTNVGFTTASVGIGGYALPAAASAVEAPAAAVALVGVSLAYDLTVAQGTVNNM